MKITKQGIPTRNKIWVGKCRSCKSEATAEQYELTNITTDPRAVLTEKQQFSWEKCPVCGIGNDDGYGGMLFYPNG